MLSVVTIHKIHKEKSGEDTIIDIRNKRIVQTKPYGMKSNQKCLTIIKL